MQKHDIAGKTILCVGARDDCEIDFFTKRGYEAVGIDLYSTDKIVECDMARIYEHSVLKDMRFDIVFSCHSLEHCLDFEGFVKSLRLVCKGYFICMMPYMPEPTMWDCQRPDFVDHVGEEDFNEKLAASFPGFEVVVSELHNPLLNIRKGFFVLKKSIE